MKFEFHVGNSPGGHSSTEGGRTRDTYFTEEGVFFKGELKAHIHISLYESNTLQE